MPYKSQAQRRLFHHLVKQGKLSPEVVEEYDRESKGKKMPERVERKAHGGEVMEPTTYRARGGEVKRRPSSSLQNGSPLSRLFERWQKEDKMTAPDASIPMTRRGWFQDNRQKAWQDNPESRTPERAKLIQRFAESEADVDPEYAEEWRKNTSGRMGDLKAADRYAHGGEVYVPLKARGGMIGNMKELYPEERGSFAKALRRRR